MLVARSTPEHNVHMSAQVPVSEYLARFPPEIQRLIREVRRVVKSVAPRAEEIAFRGWPMHLRTDRGMVAIAGFTRHVNLNFSEGSRLDDPDRLLEGTGKSMRHAKIRSVADARHRGLRKLLEQELVQGASRMSVSPAARQRGLDRVRAICLALPETGERLSHGSPTFFYRDKKAFAQVLGDFHEDGRFALWCAAPYGAQSALVKADPERFFVPPYVGTRGWLGVRLDRKPDWGELRTIISDAYAEVASPRRSRCT